MEISDQKFMTQLGLDFKASSFDWSAARKCGLIDKSLKGSRSIPSCGKILQHATQEVSDMRKMVGESLCIFKIGVTANPPLRYASYLEMGYQSMWLVHSSDSLGLTHMLEASLISAFQDFRGCRNKPGSGGEGALNRTKKINPPYFVYVVSGRADQNRFVG